jgi:hypothetical protein
MAMTEFEKKMLQEVKGINKELHELNRILKKEPFVEIAVDGKNITGTVAEMVRGRHKSNKE